MLNENFNIIKQLKKQINELQKYKVFYDYVMNLFDDDTRINLTYKGNNGENYLLGTLQQLIETGHKAMNDYEEELDD